MEAPPLDPGPLVVLDSLWTDGGCLLRIRRPGEDSILIPLVGLELRYTIGPDSARHCVGHQSPKRNEGRYVECHNRPQAGEKTCVSCAVANAEFASDLHHAHTRDSETIHGAVLDHLKRANVLYLAAFRDGSVKIGTSTGSRRHTRLVEQGAWLAVEAAAVADGFAVRRLEDLITDRLHLPQSVATTRKLRGLISPRTDDELDATLRGHLAEVHALLATDEGRAAGPATPSETWWTNPAADDPWWDRPLRYPLTIDQGNHHLRFGSACGRLAAFERPGGTDRFVDDLGRLYGRELQLGTDIVPDALAVQDSLF
jgi:hypothetical protein